MGQFSVEKPVLPGSALSGNQQRRTYGIDPEADAYDLARRAAQVRGLKTQIDERAKELAKAGDALDEEALQTELELDSAR